MGRRRSLPSLVQLEEVFQESQLVSLSTDKDQLSKRPTRFKKPKTVTCETCGREFTQASINLHRRKCTSLQDRKSRSHSRAEDCDSDPETPRAASRAQSCREASPAATAWVVRNVNVRSRSADVAPMSMQRPRTPKTVPCQICGKHFLYTSIRVHQNQCARQHGLAPRLAVKREISGKRSKSNTPRSRDPTPRGWKCSKIIKSKLQQLPCMCASHKRARGKIEFALYILQGKTPSPDVAPHLPASVRKRFVTCHICGQLFGTRSIHCHVPRCEKLWKAREAQKPIWERQSVGPGSKSPRYPTPPRVNFADMPGRKTSEKASFAPSKRVTAVVCHLCGRHFSLASIAIHLPRCQRTWEEREHLKAQKDQRKVPEAPHAALGCEEYNQIARKIYQENGAEACPRCGRRLADDKQFDHHVANCRVNVVTEEKAPPSPAPPVLVTCHLCGRDFGNTSIVASSVLFSTSPRWLPCSEALKGMETARAARVVCRHQGHSSAAMHPTMGPARVKKATGRPPPASSPS